LRADGINKTTLAAKVFLSVNEKYKGDFFILAAPENDNHAE
jgi:hypothetical protein